MLLLLQFTSCWYLFVNEAQQFVGLAPKSPSDSYRKTAAVSAEQAIDFMMGKSKNEEGDHFLTLLTSNGDAADVRDGTIRDGTVIGIYPTHGLASQQWQVVLLHNNMLVLFYFGKCVKHDEKTNGFTLQKCEGTSYSTFSIYYEVPPTPEYIKEQVYNLDNKDNNMYDGDDEFFRGNPVINGQDKRVIAEITFKNGKAIAKTPLDKDITGVEFERYPVRIRKEVRPLRHRGRERRRKDDDSFCDESSRSKRCGFGELISEICEDDSSTSDNFSQSSDHQDVKETHKQVSLNFRKIYTSMAENDFAKIPKFLRRLYRETSDPMNTCIVWGDDGERIRIVDKERFIKSTLHTLSRTKEYSAFIRQLNIYGFVKTKSEKNDDIEEYYNCFFKKDQPSLMGFMKRVRKTEKAETRINYPSIENSISYLTNANFRLSNEVSQLRDRVDKQDRTINGLLDILGRVFRTGAQSMGYETSTVQPRPDLFLNCTVEEKKDTEPEKSLGIFRKDSGAKKKDGKYIADMSDIFF